jgi:hypothetical protein
VPNGLDSERASIAAPSRRPGDADAGNVVPFARRPGPAAPLAARLERSGLAIASHLFAAYDGTLPDSRSGAHAGTIIAILATLAAEHALQAVELNRRAPLDVTREGWITGGPADDLLIRNATSDERLALSVWDVVLANAWAADLSIPDLAAALARAEAMIGNRPYPPLTVATELRPKALLRSAAARHRAATAGLAAAEGLCMPGELALAHGAAVGRVIRHEAQPAGLLQLAAEVLIGAARLVPLPYALA